MKNRFSLFLLISCFCASFVFSQEALKSIEEEYYDFLSLSGITQKPTLNYRTLSDSVWNFSDSSYTDESNIWLNHKLNSTYTLFSPTNTKSNFFLNGINQNIIIRIYGPEWFNSYNTAVPYGQNDGALWQGRGYNTSLTTGVRLEAYGLELTFKPQLSFSQNLEFSFLPPFSTNYSEYAYFVSGIDKPQRFGDSSFFTFDWGDSEIRYTWNNITVGFGTQTPWMGSSFLNPMMMSNNAPSFPKADLGLRKTKLIIPGINLNLGNIEGRFVTGKLSESKYFDNNPENDNNMLNYLSIGWEPSFFPLVTIGLNRVFVTKWDKKNLKYLLYPMSFKTHNDTKGPGEDQKASVAVNFHIPQAGFELFAEFGIDDYVEDKISDPFHTAIYTIGFKELIPLPKFLAQKKVSSEVIFEYNNFEMSQDFQIQWPYIGFYGHGKIIQGYTNKGQILGAGTGYFGNSQFAEYIVYYPRGNFAINIQRFCPNINYVYGKTIGKNWSYTNTPDEFKKWYGNYITYLSAGFSTLYFVTKSFSVNAGYNFIYIRNWNYQKGNNFVSHKFDLSLKYTF